MDSACLDRIDNNQTLSVKGKDYKDCEAKIRSSCGMNYQIIRKRAVLYGGFLGIGKQQGVEVDYIVTFGSQRNNIPNSPLNNMINSNRPVDFEQSRKKIIESVPPEKRPNPQMLQISKDLESLKELFLKAQLGSKNSDHPTICKIEALLDDNEFSSSYTRKMVERIRKEFSMEDLDDFDKIQEKVVQWIGESIQIDDYPFRLSKPKVIILVGPTGVGKTTTIAKLAANYKFPSILNNKQDLQVRIITIDTYRIQAQAQIETYGEYMDVPVSVAKNTDDLKRLIAMHKDVSDVILIDTIGFSPSDYKKIAGMRETLDIQRGIVDTYLAMSATTKASDMREIMQQFEIFDFKSVVLTKIDETKKIGNIISVLSEKNKSLSFVTNGQTVPSDIQKASIVNFLIRLEGFSINREKIETLFPPEEDMN